MQKLYIKFSVRYSDLQKILDELKIKNIIFFIDLLSISRGFYSKSTLSYEISQYVESRSPPIVYIEELRMFLNKLYKIFVNYNPKYVIFYDYGICKQNTTICKTYKEDRARSEDECILEDSKDRELIKKIKEYYLSRVDEIFSKPNLSVVINTKEYESDLVPHYIISNQLINGINDISTLNVILSYDKDLLQTTEFHNVIQYIPRYIHGKIEFSIFHRTNAISYFYDNFKQGLLTSKYIPLLLSMVGDKSDNIEGIKGIGFSRAYQLIIKHKLPAEINKHTKLPDILEEYRDLILLNYQLISFDEQIRRVSPLTLSYISEKAKEIHL